MADISHSSDTELSTVVRSKSTCPIRAPGMSKHPLAPNLATSRGHAVVALVSHHLLSGEPRPKENMGRGSFAMYPTTCDMQGLSQLGSSSDLLHYCSDMHPNGRMRDTSHLCGGGTPHDRRWVRNRWGLLRCGLVRCWLVSRGIGNDAELGGKQSQS